MIATLIITGIILLCMGFFVALIVGAIRKMNRQRKEKAYFKSQAQPKPIKKTV